MVTYVMPSTSTRVADAPNWFDSLLFLALMSGPPKFRGRDPTASLTGAIDLVVLVHLAVWTCGGLWVLARLYPAVLRRGIVPAVNPAQALGALFIAALTLSAWESPGTPPDRFRSWTVRGHAEFHLGVHTSVWYVGVLATSVYRREPSRSSHRCGTRALARTRGW